MYKLVVATLTLIISHCSVAGFVDFQWDSYEAMKQSPANWTLHYTVADNGSIDWWQDQDSTPVTFDSTNNGECMLDDLGGSTSYNNPNATWGFECESGLRVYKSIPKKLRECFVYYDSASFEYTLAPGCEALPSEYSTGITKFVQQPKQAPGDVTADDLRILDRHILYKIQEYQIMQDVRAVKRSEYVKQRVAMMGGVISALAFLFTLYKFYVKRQLARNKFKAIIRSTYAKVSSKMVEYAHNGIDPRDGSPITVYESYFNDCTQQMQDSGLFSEDELTKQKHEFNDHMIKHIFK